MMAVGKTQDGHMAHGAQHRHELCYLGHRVFAIGARIGHASEARSPTYQKLQASGRARRRGVRLGLAHGTTVGIADASVRGESTAQARRIGLIGPIELPVHEPGAYAVGRLFCGVSNYQYCIARINDKSWHSMRCNQDRGTDSGENRWSLHDLFG
jgi:hypothetical protein